MVRRGDFEINLVQAGTRQPFKEHYKDGQVYVEVEPDEEYLIRVQRVTNSFPGPLLAGPSVDGNSLGYKMAYTGKTNSSTKFLGLWAANGYGIETETSLKFTKPSVVQSGRQKSGLLMGKVEVGIYEGLLCGYGVADEEFKSSWQGYQSQGVTAGKKSLRSSPGNSSFTTTVDPYPTEQYMSGRMLDIVRLHYCSALGLIQVGVLPRPPPVVYHRILTLYCRSGSHQGTTTTSPGTTVTSTSSPPLPVITPIRIKTFCGKEEVLYDLTNLDDDDDE